MLGTPSKALNLSPVVTNQAFLLCSTPAFDLPLRRQRLLTTPKRLRPDQDYRPPRRRISGDHAIRMHPDTPLEIVRVSDVVAAVRTPQQVRPETHSAGSTLRSTSPSASRARSFEST